MDPDLDFFNSLKNEMDGNFEVHDSPYANTLINCSYIDENHLNFDAHLIG
jgi:hypothetical protein